MTKKISIIGANGIIGRILIDGLKKTHELKLFDIIPNKNLGITKIDALDINDLHRNICSSDVVINLAWNSKRQSHRKNNYDRSNLVMSSNIFEACKQLKIPRLILASSIHCHDLNKWEKPKSIRISTPTDPSSYYGKDKGKLETLGKYYSKFSEIICIRFGGIEKKDMRFWKTSFGLTHNDCIDLIRHIISLKTIENNYQIIYGLSQNENSIFDHKNNMFWSPKDDISSPN